jgi:hypothetical protein
LERDKQDYLFSDDMNICPENLSYSTIKLVELVKEFSKDGGYEINMQIPEAFLNLKKKIKQASHLL